MAIDGPASIKNTVATSYGGAATHLALFTADPGTTGTVVGEVAGGGYARQPIVWGAAAAGVVTSAPMSFAIPAGTTLLYAAACSANSGNTLLDRKAIASVTLGGGGTYLATATFTET